MAALELSALAQQPPARLRAAGPLNRLQGLTLGARPLPAGRRNLRPTRIRILGLRTLAEATRSGAGQARSSFKEVRLNGGGHPARLWGGNPARPSRFQRVVKFSPGVDPAEQGADAGDAFALEQ